MTDQPIPNDYRRALTLGDALRDVAATSAGPVDGRGLLALAARADELQDKATAFDALVPELTPVQDALLDALRDVATTADAPTAVYAGKEIGRLAAEALGYPVDRLAQPVEVAAANISIGPLRLSGAGPLVELVERATGGPAKPDRAAAEPWPFKAGTVVRDEDGGEAKWLEAAPDETVVTDRDGTEWARRLMAWFRVGRDRWMASVDLAAHGPLTVVSVPDQETNRG